MIRRLPFLILFFFAAFGARAQQQDDVVPLENVTRPELLLKTAVPGLYLPAPAVRTDIDLQVRGIIARGRVRQQFRNPADRCVEAIYAFPLPEKAAVDTLKMTVAGRTIEGAIQERHEAQRTYEAAKAAGRKASLLEQARPNLFTVSVASIAAGEMVEIEIEYQQTLSYDAGAFSLRLPLAIGPRYVPAASNAKLPPMDHRPPRKDRNPVSIEIDLDAGVPLDRIASSTHEFEQAMHSPTRSKITITDVASDRDFELSWSPQLGRDPLPVSFVEAHGDHKYVLTMIYPPDLHAAGAAPVLPRETVFVIDTSGSMEGPSMEQAKKALILALDRLRPSDSFNVIEFDSGARRLFETSRRADRDVVEQAKKWVADLAANGGTEMMAALELALKDAKPVADIRQVIFITDGHVGNEEGLFAFIRTHLGTSRLFTVGIGSAPNSHFMRNAARYGRGTFAVIGDLAQVEKQMLAMFAKLESPALSNVQVTFEGGRGETVPDRLPDLYAGEPLIFTARVEKSASQLSVRPEAKSRMWSTPLNIAEPETPRAGIVRLWARDRIDALADSVTAGADREAVRVQATALAMEHHLVTEFTSLVAVDTTPPDAKAKACESKLVPLNLPAGWGGIDGALPSTATPSRLLMLLGAALLLAALVVRLS